MMSSASHYTPTHLPSSTNPTRSSPQQQQRDDDTQQRSLVHNVTSLNTSSNPVTTKLFSQSQSQTTNNAFTQQQPILDLTSQYRNDNSDVYGTGDSSSLSKLAGTALEMNYQQHLNPNNAVPQQNSTMQQQQRQKFTAHGRLHFPSTPSRPAQQQQSQPQAPQHTQSQPTQQTQTSTMYSGLHFPTKLGTTPHPTVGLWSTVAAPIGRTTSYQTSGPSTTIVRQAPILDDERQNSTQYYTNRYGQSQPMTEQMAKRRQQTQKTYDTAEPVVTQANYRNPKMTTSSPAVASNMHGRSMTLYSPPTITSNTQKSAVSYQQPVVDTSNQGNVNYNDAYEAHYATNRPLEATQTKSVQPPKQQPSNFDYSPQPSPGLTVEPTPRKRKSTTTVLESPALAPVAITQPVIVPVLPPMTHQQHPSPGSSQASFASGGVDLSAMEQEVRVMVEKMRAFQSLDPTAFQKVWEDVKRPASRSGAEIAAAGAMSSPQSGHAIPAPEHYTSASQPVTKQQPQDPVRASRQTQVDNASNSFAKKSQWSEEQKSALTTAAVDFLATPYKPLTEVFVRNLLDRNPNFVQFCEEFENKDYKFERSKFARTLLDATPQQVIGALPANSGVQQNANNTKTGSPNSTNQPRVITIDDNNNVKMGDQKSATLNLPYMVKAGIWPSTPTPKPRGRPKKVLVGAGHKPTAPPQQPPRPTQPDAIVIDEVTGHEHIPDTELDVPVCGLPQHLPSRHLMPQSIQGFNESRYREPVSTNHASPGHGYVSSAVIHQQALPPARAPRVLPSWHQEQQLNEFSQSLDKQAQTAQAMAVQMTKLIGAQFPPNNNQTLGKESSVVKLPHMHAPPGMPLQNSMVQTFKNKQRTRDGSMDIFQQKSMGNVEPPQRPALPATRPSFTTSMHPAHTDAHTYNTKLAQAYKTTVALANPPLPPPPPPPPRTTLLQQSQIMTAPSRDINRMPSEKRQKLTVLTPRWTRSQAARRSQYDPTTIAFAILVNVNRANGKFPGLDPLNSGLANLKSLHPYTFDNQTDLETIPWKSYDPKPEGEVEEDELLPSAPEPIIIDDNDEAIGDPIPLPAPPKTAEKRKLLFGVETGEIFTPTSAPKSSAKPSAKPSAKSGRGKGRPPGWSKGMTYEEAWVLAEAKKVCILTNGTAGSSNLNPNSVRQAAGPTPGGPAFKKRRMGKDRDDDDTPSRAPGKSSMRDILQVFKCKWDNCNAELHSRETLETHVIKKHAKMAIFGGYPCLWDQCWRTIEKEVRGGDGLFRKEQSKVRLDFSTEREWKAHMVDHIDDPTLAVRGEGRETVKKAYEAAMSDSEDMLRRMSVGSITPLASPAPEGYEFTPPPGYATNKEFKKSHGPSESLADKLAFEQEVKRHEKLGAGMEFYSNGVPFEYEAVLGEERGDEKRYKKGGRFLRSDDGLYERLLGNYSPFHDPRHEHFGRQGPYAKFVGKRKART